MNTRDIMNNDLSGLKKIGKVKSAHGIKGELFLISFASEYSWRNRLTEVHLYQTCSPSLLSESEVKICLPLQSQRLHKNGLIVSSPLINNRNQAEELKGYEWYIPEEFLISQPGENIFLSEIKGFEIKNSSQDHVGTIVGFSSNGAQDLLVVNEDKSQSHQEPILIPLVPEFLEAILYSQKTIIMNLPLGLVSESSI